MEANCEMGWLVSLIVPLLFLFLITLPRWGKQREKSRKYIEMCCIQIIFQNFTSFVLTSSLTSLRLPRSEVNLLPPPLLPELPALMSALTFIFSVLLSCFLLLPSLAVFPRCLCSNLVSVSLLSLYMPSENQLTPSAISEYHQINPLMLPLWPCVTVCVCVCVWQMPTYNYLLCRVAIHNWPVAMEMD